MNWKPESQLVLEILKQENIVKILFNLLSNPLISGKTVLECIYALSINKLISLTQIYGNIEQLIV